MKLATVVLSVFGVASSQVASADCARVEHVADLITKNGAVVPADGGLLIGWKDSTDSPQNEDPAHPKWKFATPTAAVEMVAEILAPALVVHRPKAKGTGKLVVSDPKDGEIATFIRDDKGPPVALPQPKVAKLVVSARPMRYSEGRSATATLVEPAPEGAVAIITYAQRNKKQVALGFDRVGGKGRPSVVTTFSDPGHCGFNPSGTEVPAVGEKVTLVWVDQFGRLSKPSAIVVVTGEKTPHR